MIKLNKVPLTKNNLMRLVQDTDIYSFYTGSVVPLKTAIKSPLMEDNKPSFGYFIGSNGEIHWKDFRIGSGDCIEFVKIKFNLNFNQALIKIAKDLGVSDEFEFKDEEIPTTNSSVIKTNREEVVKYLSEGRKISIRARKAEHHDIKFWLDFGIDAKTLGKYNVTPISYYFVNGNSIKADKYSYAFIEFKDNEISYKIYQPFNKDYKWINNHDESVWQGWAQLPKKNDCLIITKSLKDVMSISSILNIPSVALQSESIYPKDHVVEELHSRFKMIYLLYDNDYDKEKNYGEIYAKKLCDDFGFFFCQIHEKHKSKDFSDLVKNYGAIKAYELWKNEISIPF